MNLVSAQYAKCPNSTVDEEHLVHCPKLDTNHQVLKNSIKLYWDARVKMTLLLHHLFHRNNRLIIKITGTIGLSRNILRVGQEAVIQGVRKRLYLFQKFFFGPQLFGGRHLENFVPTGTAGISVKSGSI
jgi:hypothetical protein